MTHYQTLGVCPEAEDVVIRAAYRALSQRYHPDKCAPGERDAANRRMSDINRAFHVLSETASRAEYDRHWSHRAPGYTASPNRPTERRGQPIVRFSRSLRQLAVLSGTVVLIMLWGIDEKPWWQWSWELVTSGFDKPSHYIYNWPMILTILTIGVVLAIRTSRRPHLLRYWL